MKQSILAIQIASAGLLVSQSGCAVPQPAGKGSMVHQLERSTHTSYWLYLPKDYVAGGAQRSDHPWPLVVTFHGTTPFDGANPQAREWQHEADRYGFIVIAPNLETCTCLMQFPLRDPNLFYVRNDERAILAIMEEVVREKNADPKHVLSTGWSTGGYIAHYMVNRHPDRFSCLAIREAPFSASLLDAGQTTKYRDMKVGIFGSENDLLVCRSGSRDAAQWYRDHGFSVEAKCVLRLGHQRIPRPAADFYASTLGIEPAVAPDPSGLQMKDMLALDARKTAADSVTSLGAAR